jgi:hypothetical protein
MFLASFQPSCIGQAHATSFDYMPPSFSNEKSNDAMYYIQTRSKIAVSAKKAVLRLTKR